MKVTVQKILGVHEGVQVILFSSSQGEAQAQWQGELPIVGNEYDVEFEIPAALKWGVHLFSTSEHRSAVAMDGKSVSIIGKLISVDESSLVIQVGSGIVFIETENFLEPTPEYVLIKAPNLVVFDTNT